MTLKWYTHHVLSFMHFSSNWDGFHSYQSHTFIINLLHQKKTSYPITIITHKLLELIWKSAQVYLFNLTLSSDTLEF